MWCSPQPHDIAQIEIVEKPKLSRTARRRQSRELAQQQKEVEIKEKALSEEEHVDLHPARLSISKLIPQGSVKLLTQKPNECLPTGVTVSMMAQQR